MLRLDRMLFGSLSGFACCATLGATGVTAAPPCGAVAVGVRSSTAALGVAGGVLAQPASRATATIASNLFIPISFRLFIRHCKMRGGIPSRSPKAGAASIIPKRLVVDKRSPRGLTHIGRLHRQALLDPAVNRNRCQ